MGHSCFPIAALTHPKSRPLFTEDFAFPFAGESGLSQRIEARGRRLETPNIIFPVVNKNIILRCPFYLFLCFLSEVFAYLDEFAIHFCPKPYILSVCLSIFLFPSLNFCMDNSNVRLVSIRSEMMEGEAFLVSPIEPISIAS